MYGAASMLSVPWTGRPLSVCAPGGTELVFERDEKLCPFFSFLPIFFVVLSYSRPAETLPAGLCTVGI